MLQVFLRRPGHLSLLKVLMGQSQEVREDLCLQEYHVHLVPQVTLARLSLGEIPVEEQIFIMKWIVS